MYLEPVGNDQVSITGLRLSFKIGQVDSLVAAFETLGIKDHATPGTTEGHRTPASREHRARGLRRQGRYPVVETAGRLHVEHFLKGRDIAWIGEELVGRSTES